MYACIYSCMYSLCMHACMYQLSSYACMYACVHVCMYVCTYCLCIHACMCSLGIHVCMYVCIHACTLFISMHICMHHVCTLFIFVYACILLERHASTCLISVVCVHARTHSCSLQAFAKVEGAVGNNRYNLMVVEACPQLGEYANWSSVYMYV
jgi:hypothetical protein